VIGSYHQVSVKHLPAYLDELEWRFNNRDNPFLFRDTVKALVEADTLTLAALTKKPTVS
jgi:transposase-like protein